jgi:hypothetical protein
MSAQTSLTRGNDCPYDQLEDETAQNPPVDWAHYAARGVLSNLCGRGGVGNELESIDDEIRQEIVTDLADIIRLAQKSGPNFQ